MNCPYCDSRISNLPDNQVCPHCGAPLGEMNAPKRLSFPEPPLGTYRQTFGFMEVQAHGLRFYQKFLWDTLDRFVPYSELTAVCFVPGGKKLGFLSVRDTQNENLQMPSVSREAAGDMTSVIFNSMENDRYCKVYDFLKQCADIANEARK